MPGKCQRKPSGVACKGVVKCTLAAQLYGGRPPSRHLVESASGEKAVCLTNNTAQSRMSLGTVVDHEPAGDRFSRGSRTLSPHFRASLCCMNTNAEVGFDSSVTYYGVHTASGVRSLK